MKVVFYTIRTGRCEWAEAATQEFSKKIGAFVDFEFRSLRSQPLGRQHSQAKIQKEQEQILKSLNPKDTLILFDEKGKLPNHSVHYSHNFVQWLENRSGDLVFFIGGPFGVGDQVKERAQFRVSLSPLTMNHHVAQVMALEQLYRALTIWKGVPYHN